MLNCSSAAGISGFSRTRAKRGRVVRDIVTQWVKSSERLCNFFCNFSLQLGHDLAGRPRRARQFQLQLRRFVARLFDSDGGTEKFSSALFMAQIKTTSLANGVSLAGVVSLALSCFEG